jgi:hypothetical protein
MSKERIEQGAEPSWMRIWIAAKELNMHRALKYEIDRVLTVGWPELMMPSPFEDPLKESAMLAAALAKGRNRIVRLVITGEFRDKPMRFLKKGLIHRNNKVTTLVLSDTRFTAGAYRVVQEILAHPNSKINEIEFHAKFPHYEERRSVHDIFCDASRYHGKITKLSFMAMTMTIEEMRYLASILRHPLNSIQELKFNSARFGQGDAAIFWYQLRSALNDRACSVNHLSISGGFLHDQEVLAISGILQDSQCKLLSLELRGIHHALCSTESVAYQLWHACRKSPQLLDVAISDPTPAFRLGKSGAESMYLHALDWSYELKWSKWFQVVFLLLHSIAPKHQKKDDRKTKAGELTVDLIRCIAQTLPENM